MKGYFIALAAVTIAAMHFDKVAILLLYMAFSAIMAIVTTVHNSNSEGEI